MRTTDINLTIELDDENVPSKITWAATDKPEDAPDETKCFALSLWDQGQNSTLSINLWSQKMMMGEMKKFFVQTVAGLAETLYNATGDEITYKETADLLEKLAARFVAEDKEGKL